MFSKSIALVLSASALVAAVPVSQASDAPSAGTSPFGLIAIHSTSPVHNQAISASQGELWISHAQNASCNSPSIFATFDIQDGAAYLYSVSEEPQQLWVDRSGMGQGNVGYTTGAQPIPRNGERTGFAVNEDGHLQFDNADFQVCPTGFSDGSYALWTAGLEKPAGIEGCVNVALRAIESSDPVSCLYTSS